MKMDNCRLCKLAGGNIIPEMATAVDCYEKG